MSGADSTLIAGLGEASPFGSKSWLCSRLHADNVMRKTSGSLHFRAQKPQSVRHHLTAALPG